MIPGLTASMESRLLWLTTPEVTDIDADTFAACDFALFTGRDAESRALGVHLHDGPDLLLAVTDPDRPIGEVHVTTGGEGNTLFIDNRNWRGALRGTFRLLGSDSAMIFNDIGPDGLVALPDVFLRSHRQLLYWGIGATAVSCSIEIEGNDQAVVIGDDALLSNDVWIRNYNMHAIYDLRTDTPIGRPPVTTVLERHVWLGQDALLLNCPRVGAGAIVGARAMVNAAVPPRVAVVGAPARVIREQVSWGRDAYVMSPAERRAVRQA